MAIVGFILGVAAVYLVAGFVFAIPFAIKGIKQIDEGAEGSGWGFRLIIIPGTIVFWPLLLKKWVIANNQKTKDI